MIEPTLHEVTLTNGFWAERSKLNANIAIFYQWQQLESTHCIDNFRIAAGMKEGFREGFFFADSDAYKWLDAAVRILVHSPSKELQKLVYDFIGILEKAQLADGYLYTYNQIHFAGQRWVDLQVEHEFYCLGHLIEAGVSHFEACGERRLLNIVIKAADLLVRNFAQSIPDYTDGHEEIEIALIKLWRVTDNIEYLALAKAFLERRGTIPFFGLKMFLQVLDSGRRMGVVSRRRAAWLQKNPDKAGFSLPARNRHKVPFWAGPRFAIQALSGKYTQQHQSVEKQTQAEGHAVRFTYLKTAEAMLAQVPGQEYRIKKLRSIWEQMVTRRMYVTGGIGSLPLSEGFGRDFELDPEVAYAETCAALGSMFWSHEMGRLTGEAQYEDLYEWQLYNAASVGIGRDGCSYFYNNPLVSKGEITRAGWYDIPCCPSNLSRVWASLGKNLCCYDHSEIRINQYLSGEVQIAGRQAMKLMVESTLPFQNLVTIRLEMGTAESYDLVMRLPAWAGGCKVSLNGKVTPVHISKSLPGKASANGLDLHAACWMRLSRRFNPGDEIRLEFEMPIRLLRQDKRVRGSGGKTAVTKGPVVYCLESVDHAHDIFDTAVDAESLQPYFDESILDGTWVIRGSSKRGEALVFLPYMLWANRGPSKMTVFVD